MRLYASVSGVALFMSEGGSSNHLLGRLGEKLLFSNRLMLGLSCSGPFHLVYFRFIMFSGT